MTDHPRRFTPLLWLLLAVSLAVALLPWWRHRAYLRDLYDYGIVIAANGRMERGERPYVDFKTPIQAGFLGLNWLVERAGGGNYFALTRGGAALIVATGVLLTLLLARRWPAWAAVAVGFSVTVAGASQHTILWHNALGLFGLALATWAAACAPVFRRETWPWHLAAAAGLFLGGINKLNFQLVALGFTFAWAVRAGLLRQASRGRVAATVSGLVVAGVVLPIAMELAWTGASLRLWLANVVQLAGGDRAELLWRIFSPAFLFEPLHNYYGRIVLPQAGLAGVVLSAATLLGCRASRTGGAAADRWLLPAATLLAAGAGAALLATNFEIACLGVGAWLVLMTSLWLGFGAGERRGVLAAGLVLPALVLGAAAWLNAWQGLRSQFGFSPAARADYRLAESAGEEFAYLRGLRLPPGVVHGYSMLERALPEAKPDGRRPVFYGPGLEFLDRFYPAEPLGGRPLWSHWGTTYGPRETGQLAADFAGRERYRTVLVGIGFENWPDLLLQTLEGYYLRDNVGVAIRRWVPRDRNAVDLTDVFGALSRLGGNVDSRCLHFDRLPFGFRELADQTIAIGTDRSEGAVLLRAPLYRVQGVAVIERLPGAGDGVCEVDFRADIHGAIPADTRWAAQVVLPAGQQSVRVPFVADGFGKMVELWARQPGDRAGFFVGYRELEITNAIGFKEAPALLPASLPELPVSQGTATQLFGGVAWRPQELVLRGARSGAQALELASGGEIWLHTAGMTGELGGRLSLMPGSPAVLARLVWYKGARVQVLTSGWVEAEKPLAFGGWTAEPDGWFGIVLQPTKQEAAVEVRVSRCTLTP